MFLKKFSLTLSYLILIQGILFSTRLVCLASVQNSSPSNSKNNEINEKELEYQERLKIKSDQNKQESIIRSFSELEKLVNNLIQNWKDNRVESISEKDQKKIKKIENLARKILSNQGGKYKKEFFKKLPTTFSEQVTLLLQLTSELKKEMEKSSKHTVSLGIVLKCGGIISLTQQFLQKKVS